MAGQVWYHLLDGRVSRITRNISNPIDFTSSTNGRHTGNPVVGDDFVWPGWPLLHAGEGLEFRLACWSVSVNNPGSSVC